MFRVAFEIKEKRLMKKHLTRFLLSFFIFGVLSSCSNNEKERNPDDFLIFGSYFAACSGESCVETFKLTSEKLLEDSISAYYAFYNPVDDIFDFSTLNFDFNEFDNDKFELTKDLMNSIPAFLLNSEDGVFGCPDCADGGGLIIQYSSNDILQSWLIDLDKTRVPSELHNFIDEVLQKIDIINN